MMKRIFIALIALTVILTGCSKNSNKNNSSEKYEASIVNESENIIDFADAEAFESALNSGETNFNGTIVQFSVVEYKAKSALGHNAWTGEHLNFISSIDLKLKSGDLVIAKVTDVSKSMGSWVIKYEPLKEGIVNDNTISSNGLGIDLNQLNTHDSFAQALNAFENGDYKFIKAEDLQTFGANLGGQKVYTVTRVSEVKADMVQCSLGDGFMMSSFNTDIDYTKSLKRDDVVAIYGEVESIDSYSFMGTSVTLKDCCVFAVSDDAKKYNMSNNDEGLAEYLVVTEVVANSSTSKVSEDDFKALCSAVSYEDIMRNPDSYKNKYVQVSGKVDQVIEGILKTFTFYVADSNGDKWECTYMYKEGESHILENDSVTFYGKCKGTTTSTTVLGKQVTMPLISLEYIK